METYGANDNVTWANSNAIYNLQNKTMPCYLQWWNRGGIYRYPNVNIYKTADDFALPTDLFGIRPALWIELNY